jgi:hypothetical protein
MKYKFNGPLTKYEVNAIDSLNALSYYFQDTGMIYEISLYRFNTVIYSGSPYILYSGPNINCQLDYVFSSDKKKLRIVFISSIKKHLFVSDDTEWEILILCPKKPLKLRTRLNNGNIYEIQIG